jgi:hypothetical protein
VLRAHLYSESAKAQQLPVVQLNSSGCATSGWPTSLSLSSTDTYSDTTVHTRFQSYMCPSWWPGTDGSGGISSEPSSMSS